MPLLAERGIIAHEGEIPRLSEERLRRQIDTSVSTILGLQDPDTGLTSAATEQRRDESRHMGHWWMRDQAIKVLALSNGARELTDPQSRERTAINGFVQKSVDGMFELLSTGPWQEGFHLPVVENPHTGIRELQDSKKAPPIHARTNGELDPPDREEEAWIAQNQPDAWGFLFQAVAQSAKNEVAKLSSHQHELLEEAVSYIARIQPVNLRQTSMWEWTEPGLPPTSSVAVVGKGLFDILPFINDPALRQNVTSLIESSRGFVLHHYPKDYTAEVEHETPVDLATLVAMGHDALDGMSYSTYFRAARQDLARENMPGMIRYKGDQYHLNRDEENGEAVWFMGLPYRANVLFKSAEKALRVGKQGFAKRLYAKGVQDMNHALAIIDEHGYPPELFEVKNGEYVVPQDGTSSHIGWNDAILISAGARALHLQQQLA